MTQPTDARIKIRRAEQDCDKALTEWRAAVAALRYDVSVNGYGIIHDIPAFRQRLAEAKAALDRSQAALADIELPSHEDYDSL